LTGREPAADESFESAPQPTGKKSVVAHEEKRKTQSIASEWKRLEGIRRITAIVQPIKMLIQLNRTIPKRVYVYQL
jgi:hypothetical protein